MVIAFLLIVLFKLFVIVSGKVAGTAIITLSFVSQRNNDVTSYLSR